MKSRCASTAFTTDGSGPAMRFVGVRPEGSRVQGATASSSSMISANRTPTTWPVRVASLAIASAEPGSIRGTHARNAH